MPRSLPSSVDPAGAKPSPVDEREIPTLGTVLDPEKLGKQLEGLPVSQWRSAMGELEVQALKCASTNRSTFKIVLRTDLIGKVYAEDRADVYQVMEAIRRAGFGSEAMFSIPRPVAYLPSLRLLLQERVEGVKARKIFLKGDEPQRTQAAERCAQWLARFHALAPPSGRVFAVEEILARRAREWRLLSEEGGPLGAKAKRLLERLRAAASSLNPIPMCAGHGDFSANQIIFAGGRTVVFDWDFYNIADPTSDVARFVVGLERMASHRLSSIRTLDGCAEVFLKTYLSSGGHPQVAAHLPFYRAVCYLRGALWDVKRAEPSEWHERADAMLNEGLRCLEA